MTHPTNPPSWSTNPPSICSRQRQRPTLYPALSMSGITKHYAGVAALTDVSFDVLPGEVHALLGENGAGKSTLMNIASGATALDSGTIVFEGRPLENLTPAIAQELGIAIVHQHPALLPDMTVAENLLVALAPEHLRRRSGSARLRCARCSTAVHFVGRSRGPRLVPQRRPATPPRARQGVRRLAAASHPRRADSPALTGLR